MTLQRQMLANNLENLDHARSEDKAAMKIVQRRRPGDSQREQKEQTRRKLLDAAQVVFRHYSYMETAVELVADQAGVSRTTFYRHFEGKLPLALALFDDLSPRLKATWQELFEAEEPTIAEVQNWLGKLIRESSLNQVLVSVFVQIEATEPEAQSNKFRYYDEIWQLSGFGSQTNGRLGDDMRAKFLLMMLQVDQFLYLVCVRNAPIGEEHLLNAMAEIIHNFLIEARSAAC